LTSVLLGLDGGTATVLSGFVMGFLGLAGVAWQKAGRAQEKAGQAHKTASEATTTADEAHKTASEAKTTADSAKDRVSHAIPSQEMVRVLLDVVTFLEQEVAKTTSENALLRSKLEELWRVLAEEYPDVLDVENVKPTWRES
jgi:uncharacterized protein YjbJ (UPF0337 family)